MYTEPKGAYYAEPERNTELVIQPIENARAMGLYVLVDWHILNDGNSNDHLDRAITFFDRIASSPSSTWSATSPTAWAGRTSCNTATPSSP